MIFLWSKIRGISDVGFSIFADTDGDFTFEYPRISNAYIIYFIILGLWKWVSATDDEENSENYAIIKLMNGTLRYDVLNNESI